jgi:hypothetical protein
MELGDYFFLLLSEFMTVAIAVTAVEIAIIN